MKRWLLEHVTIWWLVAIPLCGCCCELWLMIHRAQQPMGRVEYAVDWWFDCHHNPACLTSKVQGTMGAMAASAGQSTIASKEIVSTLKDLHPRANTVLDETATTLREARAAIRETTDLAHAMRADVDELAKSSDELVQSATATLQPLRASLDQIDALTRELGHQVDLASPAAIETIRHLDQAVRDLDALLADPNVGATLAHVEVTSGHLAESAASIDTALRPWREKAHLLKVILSKTWELLEHALPLLRR